MVSWKKTYEYYSRIQPRKVDWLWYPYIPYGKITVLQGDPGDGKSSFLIQLLAILSRGGVLPDGFQLEKPETIIYQCAEDSKADTVKPRLLSAGADCDRVVFIDDVEQVVTLDDQRIEETLKDTGAKFLILDPIQAFIPVDMDMQSAAKMRIIMRNMAALAEKYSCAVVLVGHLNKASGGKKLYRGLGSIDIAAIARSVLMIAREEDNPSIRYMFPIKSSLAPEGDAIAFAMDPNSGFRWIGKYVPANQFMEWEQPRQGKKERARRQLEMMLSERDLLSTAVYAQMERLGVSEKTVQMAGKEAGVTVYRKNGAWYWSLKRRENEDE